MGYTAATFDLDDTLAIVDGDRSTILAAAANDVGAPPLSRTAYLDAHQAFHDDTTRETIFAHLLEAVDATDVDPAVLADAYRRRIGRSIRPIEGVEAMLEDLTAVAPVGLVTNGPVQAQYDKLERLGWTDRFDAVLISGRYGVAKPNAAPFHEMCARLDVDPRDTVHVGDHLIHDVAGARRAGLDVIHVDGEEPPEAGVRTISRSDIPAEVPALLRPVLHS